MKSASTKSQKSNLDRELHDLWNEAFACDDNLERIVLVHRWQDRFRVIEGRNKNGRPRKKDIFDEE